MPSLNELVKRHTELTEDDVLRLHRLLADWQLFADLSFSDLVLWLPTWNGTGYVAGAQMRPTTGPTVFADDLVGTFLPRGRRPQLDEALEQGRIVRSNADLALVPAQAIPVRRQGGRVLAVVARHCDPAPTRRSRLETAYIDIAGQLARMIAEGTFPAPDADHGGDDSPRVGDGFVRLEPDATVVYASPNAVSAYRRLGLAADLIGTRLDMTTRSLVPRRGPVDEDLGAVAGGRAARSAEVESKGAVVLLRSIPLLEAGARIGGLVLVRDVTEVRRRERELLTKDATIREIHHRVKNNLQTVAALLRLQARRLDVPEGRAALEEAVRRVGSIALVHELLSTTPEETVPFDSVADQVLSMVAEVSAPDVRLTPEGSAGGVRACRKGEFGMLPAEVAMPLAMALTELVQNAIEHGLGRGPGSVDVLAERTADLLTLTVADDGAGLPSGFDAESADTLGLQIVRTLVVSELGGSLQITPAPGGGTLAVVKVPLADD